MFFQSTEILKSCTVKRKIFSNLTSKFLLLLLVSAVWFEPASTQENQQGGIHRLSPDKFYPVDFRKFEDPVSFNNAVILLDSSYDWSWDTNSGSWLAVRKSIYHYDPYNFILEEMKLNWDGISWSNANLISYIYDGNNKVINDLWQLWDGNDWVNDLLISYFYDSNLKLSGSLWQSWDGADWINSYQYLYTYDSNTDLANTLSQNWNGTSWDNFYQIDYTYGLHHLRLSSITQNWDGTMWVNGTMNTFTYNIYGNLIHNLYENWDGVSWGNSIQVTNTYDSDHNQTISVIENWNGTAWTNFFQSFATYDLDNNKLSNVSQLWNATIFENTDSISYYYHPVTSVGLPEFPGNSLPFIFPNPFSDELNIRNMNSNGTSVIYDSQGRVVKYFNSMESSVIDTRDFSAGIYLLRLIDGKNFVMIKE